VPIFFIFFNQHCIAMTTSVRTLEFTTGPQPAASIIVMHGLGASADDFVPFVQEIDLRGVPGLAGGVRWIFPNAPEQAVTINGGYRMPAWYDIAHDRSVEDAAGLKASQASIEALLAREVERGVPAAKTVVAGFSQGCAMALLVGLRHARRLAGVVGMSGYLPLAAEYASQRAAGQHSANQHVPIFLAHGTADEVVSLARGQASLAALQAVGHTVDWRTYPMGHSVCGPEVRDLQAWLGRVLGS
jgi:phospholipase/carboxylesterase